MRLRSVVVTVLAGVRVFLVRKEDKVNVGESITASDGSFYLSNPPPDGFGPEVVLALTRVIRK